MIDARHPDYTNTPADPRRPKFVYAPAGTVGDPVVTVVTPFFNTGPVFHETAACVLAQSLAGWEWVIVNDASTDTESLAVLGQYRRLDPRIRVIDLPTNSGPGAARNAGYAAARAEFVYQLDADDLIEPTTLEKLAWFLATNPQYAFAGSYDVGFGSQGYLWTHGFHEPEKFAHECPVTTHAMVRRLAHSTAGGYDGSIRGGMEDWDFWMRAAERGMWGATLPEFLGWYRRRRTHHLDWQDWDSGQRQQQFRERLASRYPRAAAGQIQHPEHRWHQPFERVRRDLPFENALAKSKPRVLWVVPWLRMGGADKFNLDAVDQLIARGYDVTMAMTVRGPHGWLSEFARRTPDVFALHHFLRPPDHAVFLRYLIGSRRPDAVIVSNSEAGYALLPYLRSVCPGVPFVDYVHMEEEHWKNGGFGRHSVGAQGQIDLTMVTSEHLKRWMVRRGADPERISVVTINVDPDAWKPDPVRQAEVRAQLGVPEGIPVILYAGRLTAQKQPMVFCETVRRLAERRLPFCVWVAGDGEDRPLVEQFLDRHRLRGHAAMLGECSSARMRELIGACDIFFLPSQWEGIALVMYEAMACGAVFVGADVGGQREVLTPGCGVLIEKPWPIDGAKEAARYAAELERLLLDPMGRAEMGRKARARIVDAFSIGRMGDRLAEGLAQAAENHRRNPCRLVSPEYGHECADRAVEMLRLQELADQLWVERELARRASEPKGAGVPASSAVQAELARIENSRAYRLIGMAKRTAVYRAIARVRFGPGWDGHAAPDPSRRLEQIKASRAYRLIESVKSTTVYRMYAARKYGPGWDVPAGGSDSGDRADEQK